jgi:hypothetical protein
VALPDLGLLVAVGTCAAMVVIGIVSAMVARIWLWTPGRADLAHQLRQPR